jgi:periplasmic protein TonB
MKRTKISMSKYILASALVLIGATIGCNSDSKKDEGSTVVSADTANAMNTTPVDNTAATTTPATDTNTAMNNSSMAKPNPAKKGMKGKVTVSEQAKSSNNNMTADNSGVYGSAEIMPAYPGGYNKMADFFASNIEYPQDATDNGIEGTVDVSFAVDETGKLSSPKVISPRIGYGIEEEALRVVNKMPTWTPGRIKGKNVKTYYTLPIRFQLY